MFTFGLVPAVAATDEARGAPVPFAGPAGDEIVEKVLDGIPVHRIAVRSYPDDAVTITVDGHIDEAVWREIPYHDNMIVSIPGTGEPGHYPTEMRMFATARGLYVGAIGRQPVATLVPRMSPRDDFIDRDTFGVTLDTTGEGLFAYWFIVGLGGSLMDGKVLPERNYQRDWDGPWLGASAVRDDGWSAEFFLPWSMMNLPEVEGTRTVGFAVTRSVSHMNERYQWPGHAYTSAQFVTALNQMQLEGVAPRKELSIIPYASVTVDRARDEDRARLGADLAWKPTPAFELTASLLPDFGAVEADDVVINLTALETFYPEKRLFFLEGNEVFQTNPRSSAGTILRNATNENFATTSRKVQTYDFLPPPISVMNTRRIGGKANQVVVPVGVVPDPGERDRPTDLYGAAKATGQLGNLRYGVLGAVEDDVEWYATDQAGRAVDIEADGRDFAVARAVYEHVADDRSAFGYMGTFVEGPLYDAAVHGLDAHFTSADGRWIIDGQWNRSDIDSVTGDGVLLDLKYSPGPRVSHVLELDYFDEQVDFNDLGFLARNDYTGAQYVLQYNLASSSADRIKDVRGTISGVQQYNVSKGQVVNSAVLWRNSLTLPGRNTIRTGLGYFPERFEDRDSRGNGAYRVHGRGWADVLWMTDAQDVFSWSFGLAAQQENLGDWTFSASVGTTVRPNDRIALDVDVLYRNRNGWIVHQGGPHFGAFDGNEWQPRINFNWFLAARHQFRLAVQWAGVRAEEDGFFAVPPGDGALVPTTPVLPNHDFTISRMTAQLRSRWEIAPLTDLYVVYNRGNNLAALGEAGFGELWNDALNEPAFDSFIVKLRYRFSN
jgi:hypothetical protein